MVRRGRSAQRQTGQGAAAPRLRPLAIAALVAGLLAAGCTQNRSYPTHPTQVGVYAGSGGMGTSVSGGMGPVSMSVDSWGGVALGTGFGPVRVGVGL